MISAGARAIDPPEALRRVTRGEVLSRAQAQGVLTQLLEDESMSADVIWGALFSAIRNRSNDLAETLGLLDAVVAYDTCLQSLTQPRKRIGGPRPVVSLTGSGKESLKTFNVSTCTAFVAAACGLQVVKPGSRALSAVSGATDILERLGVPLAASLPEVDTTLREHGICFFDFGLVAPRYASRYGGRFKFFHPLSYVLPAFCIPFEVDALMYGIADADVSFAAQLIRESGHARGAVVTTFVDGFGRVDELFPLGQARVAWFDDDGVRSEDRLGRAPTPELLYGLVQGPDHGSNTDTLLEVLEARATPGAIDVVATNAAELLVLTRTAHRRDALRTAREAILSGAALDVLHRISRSADP